MQAAAAAAAAGADDDDDDDQDGGGDEDDEHAMELDSDMVRVIEYPKYPLPNHKTLILLHFEGERRKRQRRGPRNRGAPHPREGAASRGAREVSWEGRT